MKSIQYVSPGFELPKDMTPSFARWTMLNRMAVPLLPEYATVASPKVLREEAEISKSYTYVSRRIHVVNPYTSEILDSEYFESKSNAINFFSFNSEREDEFEYRDTRTRNGESTIVESSRLNFSYGGFHWHNPINLLVVMSHTMSTHSEEFKDLAMKISQKHLSLEEIRRFAKMMDAESLEKALKCILIALMKNTESLYYKVMDQYRTDLFDEWGYVSLFDLEQYGDILFHKSSLPEVEKMLKSIVGNLFAKIDTAFKTKEHNKTLGKSLHSKPVPWNKDDSSMKPNTYLSPLKDDEIDVHQDHGIEISIYKVVLDDDANDEERMNFSSNPYPGQIKYDPPLKRGVTKARQPYKVVIANAIATIDGVEHDNHILRKMVNCDLMTRALDWAALNNLPLPPLGSEIFAHTADSTNSSKILEAELPLIVCSRERKYKFLAPFPDYSFGVFTHRSRFDVKNEGVATWDAVKDYILTSPQAKLSFSQKSNDVFFRGANFSHVYIRENLKMASSYPVMENRKVLIPKGSLVIDVPPTRGVLSYAQNPITIPQMGEHRFLLDLPGYGMWSTRLKLICLTGSVVIRVMFVDVEYRDGEWEELDYSKIWETYFDTFAPFDVVETIIGKHYVKNSYFPDMEVEDFNKEARRNVITEIGRIYQQYNRNPQQAMNVTKRTVEIVSYLTNDKISEYVYWIMMKMAEMYGHI